MAIQQFPNRGGNVPPIPGGTAFPRFESSTSDVLQHRYPSTVSVLRLGSILHLGDTRSAVEKLYERDAVYSNPLLTASSGDVIKDIHSLMHQFTAVSVPTPFSIVKSIFGRDASTSWLTLGKVWSEVGEVCESDLYDGHRKVVIEHTVYLLFLPDLFSPDGDTRQDIVPFSNLSGSPYSLDSAAGSTFPTLPKSRPTFGSAARVLMALARQVSLPVHTRLSFNDSGRIVHHQDIWDVKDVLALLIPGISVAQWISSRLLARSLASVFDIYVWVKGPNDLTSGDLDTGGRVVERSDVSRRSSVVGGGLNALGLQLSERAAPAASAIGSGSGIPAKSRAPDTDS
ncbi:hypothetical protein BS47DRAFT_1388473 [Hydnum rufescens UP504]|uniref:Uncharacterized protein n=1 Tax=Hydnum rufescens UP504 TaxID=1448309 RepID=A0A9P6E185_9AGAM|nr:hypothetical protein BS47DRAFT_1388473 [Hydnum rufescens UP504]